MNPDLLASTLLMASLDCIIAMDEFGRITEWNRAAELTFGFRRAEALGQPLGDLIVPEIHREAHRSGLARYLTTGQARVLNRRLHLEAQRRSGEIFPCELTIHAAHTGGHSTFVAYLRDSTWEARARSRQEALYAVARTLEQAATPAEVVQVILREVMPGARATRGSVGVLTAGGGAVQLLGEMHYEAATREQLAHFPLSLDIPGSHVIRTGEAVFGERGELEARFGDLARVGPRQLAAAAVLPLNAQGRVIGYLALVYDTPQPFEPEEQMFLTAMAEQCALALNRAQLLDTERWAREQMAFLAEAGELLASSLEFGITLTRVANLAVPRISDWCAVYLPDGPLLSPLALAHTDPEKTRMLREYVSEVPTRIDDADGIAEVYRTGTFAFVPTITPEMIDVLEVNEEQKARIRSLGLRSYMAVPMVAHGRPIGVMSFALAETEREFTPADLNLALELGRRAGLALDHARLHQELRESHTTLEQRVEERTRELEGRTRELERSNRELERFAFVASHDLQEPLRTIASYSGLIERRYAERLDARGLQYLGFVIQGAHRLQALINDLLVFSRLNAVREPLGPVALEDAVRVALEQLGGPELTRAGSVTWGGLPTVLGVHAELVQVFQNLIGNALKFQRPDAAPRVTVEARPTGGGWIVQVRDNGIGFEAQYAGRIFEIFQRLHLRQDYDGTGMGLAIVKKIVEHHQGRVWAESTPGEGSTFSFTLLGVAGAADWQETGNGSEERISP